MSTQFRAQVRRVALCVTVFSICAILAIAYTNQARRAAIQRAARVRLWTDGRGVALYRAGFIPSGSDDEPWKMPSQPTGWHVPYFLVSWLGEDFFSQGVYAINLDSSQKMFGGKTIQQILESIRPQMEILSDVELIDLSDTDLTDEGLMQLIGMKNLRFVMAKNTKVTARGIKALQAVLPRVHVFLDRRYF